MKISAILVSAALALTPVAAVAADIVVTASSAAGISPGRLLAPDAALDLVAGESVTLYGPKGPVEVKGPYAGAVSAALGAGAGGSSAVSALLKRRKRIASLAASRSGAALKSGEMTVMLHLLSDGVWCVDGPAPQLFIRAEKKKRVVRLVGAGGKHEILWPKDTAVMPWPQGASFQPGDRYDLEIGDIPLPQGLTLAAGASGGDASARLEAYLGAGCAAQADALMTEMAGQ